MPNITTTYAVTPAHIPAYDPEKHLAALYHINSQPNDFHSAYMVLTGILCNSRPWFRREFNSAETHPAIRRVLLNDNLRQYLTDWREMILEWPHVSDMDELKLAYTRNDADGERDRQTVTTIGRYLKRHAPNMPDHDLRDLVMLSTPDEIKLSFELSDIVRAAEEGPRSCMSGNKWDGPHPYNVYNPAYGWGIVTRTSAATGEIVGRCLVNKENLHFVRSYAKGRDYSESDQAIEAWLKDQGYTHQSEWAGDLQLSKIECSHNEFLMPYLDGDIGNVRDDGDYFTITYRGEHDAKCTSGTLRLNTTTCSLCDDCMDEDEAFFDDDDNCVCRDCLDSEYTYAMALHGDHTYVRNRYVEETREGEYFDNRFMDENNIVELHDGTYTDIDNAVFVADEWYHTDDEGDEFVCLANDYEGESYALIDDAWQDEFTGDWYHNDDTDNAPVEGTDHKLTADSIDRLFELRRDFNAQLVQVNELQHRVRALTETLNTTQAERDALTETLNTTQAERDVALHNALSFDYDAQVTA